MSPFATNARRRARGRPEGTEVSLAAEIAEETALADQRRSDDKRRLTGSR